MAILLSQEYLTFDDILIQPSLSDIPTREGISLDTSFLNLKLKLPIISANMDYVTGADMAKAMFKAGGLGILHRFMPEDKLSLSISSLRMNNIPPAFSVGTRNSDKTYDWVSKLVNYHLDVWFYITVDVAHGHHDKVARVVERFKKLDNVYVIAGNIATHEGYNFLVNAGADAVKVGIGPGSVCTTRSVTGVGVPQLSAIMDIYEYRRYKNVPIIADGGIKSSGDIVKALAAGADVVMLGNLLAGATECPGERLQSPSGAVYRPYRGQSIFGTNGLKYTPEGISGFVPDKGPVENILKQLSGGIRSGMSYVGAENISELRENAVFIRVSNGTKLENDTRVQMEVA